MHLSALTKFVIAPTCTFQPKDTKGSSSSQDISVFIKKNITTI